uniref:Peptidase A1 domain-containing protein n=1 Tax=Salix viminalis TaxID=40686 RepID=A0A6N2ML80_SALVM
MAKLAFPPLILFFLLSFIPSQAALPLHTPIQKDHSTGQYIISAYLKTPLKLTKLLLDLGATYSWVNCDDYISSTYQHIPCNGSLAKTIIDYGCMNTCDDPPGPNCGNNSSIFLPNNPIKAVDYRKVYGVNAALVDSLALPDTQGSLVSINNFIFSCARTGFLKGLARGVTGLASLGNSMLSIPVQINKAFSSTPNCFAMCLSGSTSQPGLALFGMNGKVVALNKTLLAIDGESGFGGTRISTVVPYTKLQSSIYKAFTLAFLKEAASSSFNLTTTKPVKPFGACYPASAVKNTQKYFLCF